MTASTGQGGPSCRDSPTSSERVFRACPCVARGVGSLVTRLAIAIKMNLVTRRSIRQLWCVLNGQRTPHRRDQAPHSDRLPIEGDVFARLHVLVCEHLDPFIRQVAAWARMSPMVLWSTGGHIVDWMLREIEALPGLPVARPRIAVASTGSGVGQADHPTRCSSPSATSKPVSARGGSGASVTCATSFPNGQFCGVCPQL